MEYWWTYRNEVIDPTIEKHQGRIVKHTGDGFLAEFSTVKDAVQCAFEIQSEIKQRNRDIAEDKRMEFRMGVNLGDIIVDDEDIYGDGVNIAARLEGLADPGGIFVSGDVFNQVHNKLDLTFEDLGEKTVKNIPDPIRVHRILLEEIVGDIVHKELESSLEGAPLVVCLRHPSNFGCRDIHGLHPARPIGVRDQEGSAIPINPKCSCLLVLD